MKGCFAWLIAWVVVGVDSVESLHNGQCDPDRPCHHSRGHPRVGEVVARERGPPFRPPSALVPVDVLHDSGEVVPPGGGVRLRAKPAEEAQRCVIPVAVHVVEQHAGAVQDAHVLGRLHEAVHEDGVGRDAARRARVRLLQRHQVPEQRRAVVEQLQRRDQIGRASCRERVLVTV